MLSCSPATIKLGPMSLARAPFKSDKCCFAGQLVRLTMTSELRKLTAFEDVQSVNLPDRAARHFLSSPDCNPARTW